MALFRAILSDSGLAGPAPLRVDLVAVLEGNYRVSPRPTVAIYVVAKPTIPYFGSLQPLTIRLVIPIGAVNLTNPDLMTGYIANVQCELLCVFGISGWTFPKSACTFPVPTRCELRVELRQTPAPWWCK
jgi:hypothetical protein